MAFVIVAFSAAGISARDLNERNWSRRQSSSNSSLAEMVVTDGGLGEGRRAVLFFPPEAVWKHGGNGLKGGFYYSPMALLPGGEPLQGSRKAGFGFEGQTSSI